MFWSDEDQAFIATADETPGIAAIQATPLQAFSEFHLSMEPGIREFMGAGGNLSNPITISAPGS